MKVLQVINSLATGGAEKLLVETLPRYHDEGMHVDLLVLNGSDYPLMSELKSRNTNKVYSLGDGSLYNPAHILKIIPYLRKYDIVHVHLFPAQYLTVVAKLLSPFSKASLIFTEHNTTNRRMENFLLRKIDRYFYRSYTKVVCITQQVKDVLATYLPQFADRLVVINNGVDLQKIQDAKPYERDKIQVEITPEDKLIMQVAGFRKQKDQATLIRAARHLPENVKVLLIGEGNNREKCEDLVRDLKLSNRVFFLGVRNDVPQLLKSIDISVISSHWEGFGLVAVESMAAGKPLIASDNPGLSDVVGEPALLFQIGNDEELASKLLKLLEDDNYYNEASIRCLERSGRYDLSLMVNLHIKLYESILKNKKAVL